MVGEVKILAFSEGVDSIASPTEYPIIATSVKVFANDAAYVTAKGSAAALGDFYTNSTLNKLRFYDGTNWQTIEDLKNNYAATSAPTVTDDFASAGYEVGSKWFDTTSDRIYFCIDSTTGAAIWTQVAVGNNLEWQPSALSYIIDNTVAPPTEVNGDRYVLSASGGAPNAAYDGASAGNIVQFNGTIWIATVPTLGTFISVDDAPTLVYYWSGAAWVAKYWEKTTASTGLTLSGYDVRLVDAVGTNAISVSSGAISANVDNSTIEINANALRAKANGITENELYNADGQVDAQSFVLPTGYTKGAGTVAALDTVDAAVRKLDGNIGALDFSHDVFSGDGSTVAFVTTLAMRSAEAVWVYVDGLCQTLTTHYSVTVGTKTITFVTAPALGQSINIKFFL